MEYEQLSFFEPIKREPLKIYDATICGQCLCNKCIYSVAIYPPLTKEEMELIKPEDSCWNCEECYYYGMDNESLSKDIVRFKCSKFKKANHYIEKEKRHIELKAKRRRKRFKII